MSWSKIIRSCLGIGMGIFLVHAFTDQQWLMALEQSYFACGGFLIAVEFS